MCLFKRKKKEKTSYQDWHNNINNFYSNRTEILFKDAFKKFNNNESKIEIGRKKTSRD